MTGCQVPGSLMSGRIGAISCKFGCIDMAVTPAKILPGSKLGLRGRPRPISGGYRLPSRTASDVTGANWVQAGLGVVPLCRIVLASVGTLGRGSVPSPEKRLKASELC